MNVIITANPLLGFVILDCHFRKLLCSTTVPLQTQRVCCMHVCVCVSEVCPNFPALAVLSTQPSHEHSVMLNRHSFQSDLKAATVNNDGTVLSLFIHFIYLK